MKRKTKKLFKSHGGVLKDLMIHDGKLRTFYQKKILTLPLINLNPRQLCDLELLLNGAFSPLEGFLDEENYESVVSKMRLKNGLLWPIPIVLDVHDIAGYKIGSELLLCDEYGKPLAIFEISSIYKPDKKLEAKYVYGTLDRGHFGVNYLFYYLGEYYLGGKIYGLDQVDHYDFIQFRHTPYNLQTWFSDNKWDKVIGFQTRNPIHKAHYSMIKTAAADHNAKILIHPTVGLTKEGDIDYITRVRAYIKLHENYVKDISKLSLLPLAMRMAGPKEALLHTIIRKNYGCTHFIIGRDHAGPGKDSSGKPYYGPYDAQNLVKKYEEEIGIKIIPFQEMVYVEELSKYIPINQVKKKHTVKNISGTEFRRRIINNEAIPEWFSFPELITEIKRGVIKERKDGITIFFTGLPCSGKSTIARMLYFRLLELQDKEITLLDGDVIRQNLSKGLGFTREDRDENIKRIGFVANLITIHGGIAICSAIAPYEQSRQTNRSFISKNGTYIQVYLSTPINICKKRDLKGLYKKAKLGIIKGLTGIDDPYEVPKKSEIKLDTRKKSAAECTEYIINYLTKNRLITLHN